MSDTGQGEHVDDEAPARAAAATGEGRRRRRRPMRLLAIVAGSWLGVFVTVNLLILLAGVGARIAGKDPRAHDEGGWPAITNLRVVDDHLLVGAQPTEEDYRELAERGVTLVIDMRTGGDGESGRDDADQLAALGVEYASVPVPDGRAPTPAQIRDFLDVVASTDGRVFAHCGGGVGRSTTIASAYLASKGQDPSVLEQLATGPPTVEQIWFVATMRPNHPEHSISPVVATVSRLIDMPRTVYGWVL